MAIKSDWIITLERYSQVLDKALDWYNLAQEKKGTDRGWCLLNYQKYDLLRKKLSTKLAKLAKEGIRE